MKTVLFGLATNPLEAMKFSTFIATFSIFDVTIASNFDE
jgi:hypothetical protein